MRLKDLRETISNSQPDQWNIVGGFSAGPTYVQSLGEVLSPEARGIEVAAPLFVAVFAEDVNIKLAYGTSNGEDLNFDFGGAFPDRQVDGHYADVFYAGSLVDRGHVLSVDGGRGVLPHPTGNYLKFPDGDYDLIEYQASRWDWHLARILHGVEARSDDFDEFVRRARIAVLD